MDRENGVGQIAHMKFNSFLPFFSSTTDNEIYLFHQFIIKNNLAAIMISVRLWQQLVQPMKR